MAADVHVSIHPILHHVSIQILLIGLTKILTSLALRESVPLRDNVHALKATRVLKHILAETHGGRITERRDRKVPLLIKPARDLEHEIYLIFPIGFTCRDAFMQDSHNQTVIV